MDKYILLFRLIGIKIAVCPKSDIWYSFPKLKNLDNDLGDLNKFNKYMNSIVDIDKFPKFLEMTIEESQKKWNNKNVPNIFCDYADLNDYPKNKKIKDLLNIFFDPSFNKFKLGTSLKSMKSSFSKPKELWFDGNCVAIKLEKYSEFKDI